MRPEDSIRVGRILRVLNEFVRPPAPGTDGSRGRFRFPRARRTDPRRRRIQGRLPALPDRRRRGGPPGTPHGSISWAPSPPVGPGVRWPWVSASEMPAPPDSAPKSLVWRDGRPVQGLSPNHSEYLITPDADRRGGVDLFVEAAANPPSPFGANPWPMLASRTPRRSPVHPSTGRPPCPRSGVRSVLARLSGTRRDARGVSRRGATFRTTLCRARASLQQAASCRTSRDSWQSGSAGPRGAAGGTAGSKILTRSASSATPIWTPRGSGPYARQFASVPAPSARCSSSWIGIPSTGSRSPRPNTSPGCATTIPSFGRG